VTGVSCFACLSLSCVKCQAATKLEVSSAVYGPDTAPHKETGQCESVRSRGQIRGQSETLVRSIRFLHQLYLIALPIAGLPENTDFHLYYL